MFTHKRPLGVYLHHKFTENQFFSFIITFYKDSNIDFVLGVRMNLKHFLETFLKISDNELSLKLDVEGVQTL